MNVLWVLKNFGLGGAERLLLELEPHMPSATLVPVAVSDEMLQIVPQYRERGYEPRVLGSAGSLDPRWIVALRRMIRDERPDLLHLHLPYPGVGGRLAGVGLGVPIVYTEHSVWAAYHPATRWANALTLAMSDLVVAVSHDVERSILGSPLGRLSRRKIRVIRNGIDPDRVRAEAEREPTDPIPEGSYGSITALSRWKAVDVLVAAAALLAEEFPDRRCIVVGGGELLEEMRALVSDLAPGVVDLLGVRADARAVMGRLDIVILSSRTEGLPLALLEAMALGKPVVATNVGGVPEVVEDGVSGLLVPAGDPTALASAVARLLRDPDLAARLGAAGKAEIDRHWHIRTTAAQLLDVYREVLAAGN